MTTAITIVTLNSNAVLMMLYPTAVCSIYLSNTINIYFDTQTLIYANSDHITANNEASDPERRGNEITTITAIVKAIDNQR